MTANSLITKTRRRLAVLSDAMNLAVSTCLRPKPETDNREQSRLNDNITARVATFLDTLKRLQAESPSSELVRTLSKTNDEVAPTLRKLQQQDVRKFVSDYENSTFSRSLVRSWDRVIRKLVNDDSTRPRRLDRYLIPMHAAHREMFAEKISYTAEQYGLDPGEVSTILLEFKKRILDTESKHVHLPNGCVVTTLDISLSQSAPAFALTEELFIASQRNLANQQMEELIPNLVNVWVQHWSTFASNADNAKIANERLRSDLPWYGTEPVVNEYTGQFSSVYATFLAGALEAHVLTTNQALKVSDNVMLVPSDDGPFVDFEFSTLNRQDMMENASVSDEILDITSNAVSKYCGALKCEFI